MIEFPSLSRLAKQQAPQEVELAEIVSLLPNLKSLILESNTFHTPFLEHLPHKLHHLKIANCPELTSDMLHSYLSKDGSCELRELVLDHNARLDLAFLPSLQSTCPKLETLTMDLHYYSTRHTVDDAEAKYDYLLGADEVPTWPSTLRKIELLHLQKWTSEGAQNLFRSLIDSAKDLPDLRTLILRAHINIAWRDRVDFKDQWINRLQRVFLRRSVEPDPKLASLKAFRLSKQTGHSSDVSPKIRLRFSHVEITPRKPPLDNYNEADSDSEPLSKRRSKRIADHEREVSQAAVTDSSQVALLRTRGSESEVVSVASDDEEPAEGDWRNTPEAFLQNMCDVVDVTIDNQRPREE